MSGTASKGQVSKKFDWISIDTCQIMSGTANKRQLSEKKSFYK